MKLSAIVAASENNAIGLHGSLLWSLPKDTRYFKDVTTNHYVLMGRKSWEGIPAKYRPLSGRVNLVITRQKDYVAEGAIVLGSLDEGIAYAKKNNQAELMITGGGEIYTQSLPILDRIYITRVHHSFDNADAFFPVFNEDEWTVASKESHQPDEKHQYAFDFIVLDRVRP